VDVEGTGQRYGLESSDFGFLSWVIDRVLHVVQCDTAICSAELIVAELRNTFVRAVLRAEVEDSGPVLLQ
jgi:hypothetical protein